MKDKIDLKFLEQTSRNVRASIVKSIANAGAGHPGGALSATDILVSLYFEAMNIDPKNPGWEERDRFILSKGHASIALYSVLAEKGYFSKDELPTFDHTNSRLQGHPDMTRTPGVDMSSGSLGQGLSVGIGMALAARFKKSNSHIYVLMGDGELQEGQVWEAMMAADHYHIDNLTAIVDINELQLLGAIDDIFSISGSLKLRWEAFGWNVLEVNGHDTPMLIDTLELARSIKGSPTVILARTIKGKGVSFMEAKPAWHSGGISPDELKLALADIEKSGGCNE